MFCAHLRRAALVTAGWTVITAIGVASPAKAGEAKAATPRATAVTTQPAAPSAEVERAALRDSIRKLERSLRQRLAAAERGAPHAAAERDAARDARRLDVLRRAAKRLGAGDVELVRKVRALRPLLREVERREAAGHAAAPSRSAWTVEGELTRLDAAGGAACGEALAVGEGRFAAAIGTGATASREVWLRHTAAAAGMILVSTVGSDFDTVVEVYGSCPAAGAAPIARGDDEVGLQARAAFRAEPGETSWIRVSGWEGAAGTAVVAVEGGVTGFAGTITREDNGQPLSYWDVEVWTSTGSYFGSTGANFSGEYILVGLTPGTYFASTAEYSTGGLVNELYDDRPCVGGAPQGCDPTTGTPIVVTSGAILTGIDFALGVGGKVTGRVRDAATGAPLAYAEVEIFNAAGYYIDDVSADVAGRYTMEGLGTGTVYARANGDYGTGYRPELYRDIPCPDYSCTVTTGTPIAVTLGQTTAGIDFALDELGSIAGTLTRVQDGQPIPYGEVEVFDSQGDYRTYTYANAAGQYTVSGLDAGTYFVTTYTSYDYIDELYDNLPCDDSCTPTSGSPIAVTLGNTTSGINFALRRWGSISGTVTDATTAAPITSYTYVAVYGSGGSFVTSDSTYSGTYTVSGLAAGTYYLYASSELYRAELYDNVPCHGGVSTGCSLSAGTPVVVQLDANSSVANFALNRLGKIAGTITDQATGAPVYGTVNVWSAAGQSVAYAYSNAGVYEVQGLAPGTYYVIAQAWEYLPELYNGLNCPGGAPPTCNPASGTPVSVSLGTTTSGVNFTLAPKGGIAGTVRDLSTAAGIVSAGVTVYNSTGAYVASTSTTITGTYELKGLDSGNYYVVAAASGYSRRLYNGLPCPAGNCTPTAGTPVPVTVGVTTGNVNLNLPQLGTITGTVTSNSGPLSSMSITLYDSNGNWQGNAYTGSDGRYQLRVEQGSWFVFAGGGSDYVSELYNDIPCPNSCSVTAGTPVGAVLGATTSGIDFKLDASRGILGCVVGETGQPLVGVAIDLWSSVGVYVGTMVTGATGCYRLLPNNSGTYFVSTDSGAGLVEELWNNVPCPLGPAYAGRCNPTTGTPINLPSWNTLVTGVNFTLDVGRIFRSGFESGEPAWPRYPP